MNMQILDFKRKSQGNGLFVPSLKDPLFCIFIKEEGTPREIWIQLHGEFPPYVPVEMDLYNEEAYRNYKILKEYLLSDKGQEFLDRLDLDRDKVIIGLFKVLVNNYSCYGWFKKKLLVVLEYLKYYSGRIGI